MNLSPASDQIEAWFTPRRFAVLLAVLIAVAFPDVLFGGRTFFYRDYGVLAYPTVHYFRESLWRGEVPLWNPLSNCGVPFLAQWGTMVCYPGALIYLVLPLPWSLGFFTLAHLFLAGLGMYFLARRWAANDFAASLAGVIFAFNGVTLSCLIWPNYLVALGWMPWVVSMGERAWREGGRLPPLAAIIGAFQVLSGVPELVLFTWLVLGFLWLGALAWSTEPRWRVAARFLGILALVLGLTAVQTLPFLDLLAHSQRDRTFATAKWAMPSWGSANLLVPLFHSYQNTQVLFFQTGQEFFSSTYMGAGVLLMAGWAAGRARCGRVILLVFLAVAGLAFAVGENGPVYRGFRWALPLAGVARYPVKFVLLVAFVLPLLTAYGAARWITLEASARKREGRWLGACALLLLVAMAALLGVARLRPLPLDQWPATLTNTGMRAAFLLVTLGVWWILGRLLRPQRRILAAVSLLLLVWLDFQTHVPRQNPTIHSSFLMPDLAGLASVPRLGTGRVMITPRAEEAFLRSRVADFSQDFLGKRLARWSNLNLIDAAAKVNGSATLQIREQAQVQNLLYTNSDIDLPRLADFLGVTQISSPTNVVEWVARSTAMPLITAGQRPLFTPPTAALSALTNADFDARLVVYLPEAARGVVRATNAARASVRMRRFAANTIDFDVEATEPAWVVIAQSWYHPWRALVGDQPARVWRANHAFQALEVPAGASRVRLAYVDDPLRLGLVISVVSVLACAVWARLPVRPRQ